MASFQQGLSLDVSPSFVPKSICDFINEVSMIGDVSIKVSKVEGLVMNLEEETKKIEAFKRELPLCMILLNDAVWILKRQLMQFVSSSSQPLLEEFIPLNNKYNDEEQMAVEKENESRDKKNWMNSVRLQLWNVDEHHRSSLDENVKSEHNLEEDDDEVCRSKKNEDDADRADPPGSCLSLLIPGIKNVRKESASTSPRTSLSGGVSSASPTSESNLQSESQISAQQQAARKHRRCWSSELHHRFVDALRQLGGSQAATPKKIRELMQVDGLTNDEVKSHLQKYRLHIRRSPPPSSLSSKTQPLVVLGGLWLARDRQHGDARSVSSQSGSPQGPLQLAGNTLGTSLTGGDSVEEEDDDDDAKSKRPFSSEKPFAAKRVKIIS